MASKFIIVEVSDRDSSYPGLLDHKEALFDFGIGAPDEDGQEWVNMKGMCYSVESITVSDTLRPTLTNVKEVYTR
jgi:hypothetical protein